MSQIENETGVLTESAAEIIPVEQEELTESEVGTQQHQRDQAGVELVREVKVAYESGERVEQCGDTLRDIRRELALEAIRDYQNDRRNILREKQRPVLDSLVAHLEAPASTEFSNSAGYFELPTGSGKTVIFTQILNALGSDQKSLVVVPTLDLVGQVRESLNAFAPELSSGQVAGGKHELGEQVTVLTYDSFVNRVRDGSLQPEDIDTLILDEAHRSLGPTRREAVEPFLNDSVVLGFTATPEFDHERNVESLLGDVIHRISPREAIELGMTSSVETVVFQLDFGDAAPELAGDNFNQEQLDRYLLRHSNAVLDHFVDFHRRNIDELRDEKFIAFGSSVEWCKQAAEYLTAHGIKADHTSGEDSKEERKRKQDLLRNGEIAVLLNSQLLREGYDDPSVGGVVMFAPTASKVDCSQKGGRGTRIDPESPEKVKLVVQYTIKEESRRAVLYADVIEGASVVRQKPVSGKVESGEENAVERRQLEAPDVEGISAYVSDEQVSHFVGTNELLEKAPRGSLSVSGLSSALLVEGIPASEEVVLRVSALLEKELAEPLQKNYRRGPMLPPESVELVAATLREIYVGSNSSSELVEAASVNLDQLRNTINPLREQLGLDRITTVSQRGFSSVVNQVRSELAGRVVGRITEGSGKGIILSPREQRLILEGLHHPDRVAEERARLDSISASREGALQPVQITQKFGVRTTEVTAAISALRKKPYEDLSAEERALFQPGRVNVPLNKREFRPEHVDKNSKPYAYSEELVRLALKVETKGGVTARGLSEQYGVELSELVDFARKGNGVKVLDPEIGRVVIGFKKEDLADVLKHFGIS